MNIQLRTFDFEYQAILHFRWHILFLIHTVLRNLQQTFRLRRIDNAFILGPYFHNYFLRNFPELCTLVLIREKKGINLLLETLFYPYSLLNCMLFYCRHLCLPDVHWLQDCLGHARNYLEWMNWKHIGRTLSLSLQLVGLPTCNFFPGNFPGKLSRYYYYIIIL